MANFVLRRFKRNFLSTSILHAPSSKSNPLFIRGIFCYSQSLGGQHNDFAVLGQRNCWCWGSRSFSNGLVNLVVSEGRTKFETHEAEPPSKHKWKTKKKLKMQRKRDKQKRKSENKRDPRYIGIKGKKKHKFESAEERIKYKIDKAKIKEALLIERLKKYQVRRQQGPVVEPEDLTGEERFYMKKMAQKSSNYLTVGRRGVFGGVVLNMHLHWKKHETVKVICKPCKPGQVHHYAEEISRLSGGIPIQIIGNDTIIFYRGKNYVQPEVMSPVDTLSKKKALEKSKYEQSLESVRRFIAIAEKELELYYRHVALYGDPNDRSSYSAYTSSLKGFTKVRDLEAYSKSYNLTTENSLEDVSDIEYTTRHEQQRQNGGDSDDASLSETETDVDYESSSDCDVDSEDEEETLKCESSVSFKASSSMMKSRSHVNNQTY